MVVLSARNFTWILISDILVFVHSFRYWTKELLFRGGFSKVGELLLRGGFFLVELLFRDRFSVFGGLSKLPLVGGGLPRLLLIGGGLSRLLLVGWRIIELLACLARSAGTSACCRGRI